MNFKKYKKLTMELDSLHSNILNFFLFYQAIEYIKKGL